MTSPEGTRLHGGRYEIRGILGEGAQGTTYEAIVVETQRAVAIKRFDVRGAKGWKDVELAEREARVLATLDHPLLPRYVEHFEEDGALYLVMEKVEGETLEALRRRHGAFSESEVRRFLSCADRALTYLHGRGAPVIHRDIKPRNVLRRPDGSYVLVDFGAVREVIQRRDGSTVVGTMGFMAPEQFQGRAFPQTDVFAVGATALAALTGAEPETLPHRGLRIDVRAAVGDRVSPALVEALERMVEPDPDVRVGSVGLALESVHQAGASRPPEPAHAAAPPPATRPKSPLRWLWLVLFVVLALSAGKNVGRPREGKILTIATVVAFILLVKKRDHVSRVLQEHFAPTVRQPIASPESARVRVQIPTMTQLPLAAQLGRTELQAPAESARYRRAG